VTRDGHPVAELRPLMHQPAAVAVLLDRWRRLPGVDPERFQADVDAVMDPGI